MVGAEGRARGKQAEVDGKARGDVGQGTGTARPPAESPTSVAALVIGPAID